MLLERFKDSVLGKRKYISIQASAKTQEEMYNYCKRNGLDLTTKFSGELQSPEDFDFHCTIMYSTTRHDDLLDGIHKTFVKAEAGEFDVFGENRNCLVAHLISPGIVDLHEMYKQLGFKNYFPEYKPHMTLTYNFQRIPDEEIDFPLTFDRIVIKDQK